VKEKLIFIVDDDDLVTSLVAMRLRAEGYRIRSFSYGEDCIAALNEFPDAVVLDFYFLRDGSSPMNGMEVFEKIKIVEPELPVIMLSAQEKGEVVLELARKGIADYIIKDSNLISNLKSALKDIFER
jgi:two-component system, OmpR family, response regulator